MTSSDTASDSYKHWRSAAFNSSWLLYAGYYLCRENLSTVLTLPSAPANQDSLAKLLFTFALADVIGHILAGTIADLRGPRHIALLGGLISATAITGMVFSHHLSNVLALQLLNGFGQGLGFPALAILLATWFTRSERPSVLAW
jgi:sugar phosphate permease